MADEDNGYGMSMGSSAMTAQMKSREWLVMPSIVKSGVNCKAPELSRIIITCDRFDRWIEHIDCSRYHVSILSPAGG